MTQTKGQTPGAARASATESNDGLRPVVLVVDDHADFRQTLCQSIELQGHRVLEASTGDEALDVMADVPVHVLVTDISMPGLNGVELIRQVRKRSSPAEPRIIVMTGQEKLSREVKSTLTGLGVVAFLRKPFQMSELIEALVGA